MRIIIQHQYKLCQRSHLAVVGGFCLRLSCVLYYTVLARSLRPRDFPPGPRAWPFVDNVHHFASLQPFLQFTDLRSRYGDIVGLKVGPTNIVVLNSPDVCRELLQKRAVIYSGPPFGFIEREYVILDSSTSFSLHTMITTKVQNRGFNPRKGLSLVS